MLKERDDLAVLDGALCLPPARKELGALVRGAATVPTDDDLKLINQYALRPVTADEVSIVPIRLANTELDRSNERFPKAYLDRFAETIQSKSMMIGHDHSQAPAGRVFDAEVRKSGDGHYLFTRAYMRNDHPLTADVMAGVAKGASIGFQPDIRLCDLCGKDYDGYWKSSYSQRAQADDEPCSHIAGREYDGKLCTLTYGGDLAKVEALEQSLVWLGCQRGAETSPKGAWDVVTKSAHFDALALAGGKGESMDPKELAAAQARVKELEAEIAPLKTLATEGEAYRKWLKSEIGRLYTSMEDGAAGAALLGALDSSPAEALEKVRVAADARHAKLFAPVNAETGGASKGMELPKTTVTSFLFGARRGGE